VSRGRRRRALLFGSAAAVCAGLAAGASGGPATGAVEQLGELRPVLVTTGELPARRRLDPRAVRDSVEVRRVPDRFLPAGALEDPAQLLGRRPAVVVPPGSYLLATQFASPQPARRIPHRLDADHHPVEIAVQGSGVLAGHPPRRAVDVVVTTEPGPGARGRTYVAARAVELLELRPAAEPGGTAVISGAGGEPAVATLALTRVQALRLIQAESFARSVRLIAG
jgi:Flp pilus assembly protein CpaB